MSAHHDPAGASHTSVFTATPKPDTAEIRRALDVLFQPEDVIELRALFSKGRKQTSAGYYDPDHRADLTADATKLNAAGAAVYVTMNAIDHQLLARYANRVQDHAQATATDANVIARRWLLVDLDPVRPKETSATDEQLEATREKGRGIYSYLIQRGWPKPVVAESGNGVHLLFRIDLPNDDESRDLVKGCLEALAQRFNDKCIKVDTAVFNAARIVKLPGTVALKGDNVALAPWRVSRLVAVPDEIVPVSHEQLRTLAAEVVKEKPAPTSSTPTGRVSWQAEDVEKFLARGGIEANGPEPHEGALRWKLKSCPFNSEHGYGESAVFLRPDGRLGFECRHNSCQGKHWADLRDLVDGPRELRQSRAPAAAVPAKSSPDANWPAPQPLPNGLPPVQAFDFDLLPPVLRRRVEDVSERMQCPPDFPAIAVMVMAASLIGRRCGIAPKRADDWTVVPNLWGMAIGRPGIMKSPPLTEIMRPLQVLQARASEHYESAMTEHQAGEMVAAESERVAKDAIRKMLKEGRKVDARERAEEAVHTGEDEPSCRRYVVNDSTVEKLGEILNENPHGVLLFRDELNGFIRSMEKQGHEVDRAFYLECWNGDNSFTYDRIGRGTLHIPGACLSILGSIQPGPLADLVRGLRGTGDDGFLQRFQLAVWPDVRPEWHNVDRAPDQQARAEVQSLIDRLDRMTAVSLGADPGTVPILRFSDEAQSLFDSWREQLEMRLRGDIEHPMFEAHLAKYRSLVPSLALIIHLAEVQEGPVEHLALVRAIAWADYLESHARRIYAPAISPDMDAARCLAKRIRNGSVSDGFNLKAIYNNGWSGISTRDQAAAAVDVLLDHDWLREVQVQTAGRHATVYRINPGVDRIEAKP